MGVQAVTGTDVKARRLLGSGRVHLRDATVAVVDGESGRYRVAWDGHRWACDCAGWSFRQRCAHTRAVVLVTSPPPDEWAPMSAGWSVVPR